MTTAEPLEVLAEPTELSGSARQRAEIASWLEGIGKVDDKDSDRPASELLRQSDQVDEAYKEFWRRKTAGETVDPVQFCEEHAEVWDSLNCVLRLHDWLEEKDKLSSPKKVKEFPAVGETFLGFRLLRELGRGTFARVYLAAEKALGDRHVVVKVSEDGNAEARMLGRIKHDNIVPVFSVDRDAEKELSAVCMPYLGSATLCDVLVRVKSYVQVTAVLASPHDEAPDRTALPVGSPLRGELYLDGVRVVGAQLADALRCIHNMGIYHRDLKPSNVLITEDDRPMLLDFNLSADSRASAARVGGTLPYMSPEQLRALKREPGTERHPFDPRSDLYSLGVIFYELATGRHPLGAVNPGMKLSDAQTLYLKLQQRGVVPSRRLNPALPEDVARLIDQCLEYDLEKRPASAAELTKALRREMLPQQQVARRKTWKMTAAACLVFALVAMGAIWWSQQNSKQANDWEQGQQAYRDAHYAAAIRHFSPILEKDPARYDVLIARARAYIKLGETEDRYYKLAMIDLTQAGDLRNDGEVEAGYGYCEMKTHKRPAQALMHFKKAIEQGYSTAEVHNDLAFCLTQVSGFNEAETQVAAALRHNPQLRAALYNRAMIRLAQAGGVVLPGQGQAMQPTTMTQCLKWLEEGKADLKDVLRLGPVTPTFHRDMADLWTVSARFTPEDKNEAFELLKIAVQSGGKDPAHSAKDMVFFQALVDDPRFNEFIAMPKVSVPAQPNMRILNPMR